MRIFKGLENIHSVIDRHEIEWRKENGEPVDELSSSYSIEESVRRGSTVSEADKHGRFDPDRFLGASNKADKKENKAEVISVIPEKDGKPHSWLYHEVVKAVNDAAGNDRNVKVIAVFIPVIQNGKEFEDLPVDTAVTLPPVYVEDVDVEKILEENAKENSELQTEQENENENPQPLEEENKETSIENEQKPDDFDDFEIVDEHEPEPHDDFDLIPEGPKQPDEELAEAFTTMEEKLDEALGEQEKESDTDEEINIEQNLEEQEPPQEDEPSETIEIIAPDDALDDEDNLEIPVIEEEESETPVEDLIEEIPLQTPEQETEEENKETLIEAGYEPEEEPPALPDDFDDFEIVDDQDLFSDNEKKEDEQP